MNMTMRSSWSVLTRRRGLQRATLLFEGYTYSVSTGFRGRCCRELPTICQHWKPGPQTPDTHLTSASPWLQALFKVQPSKIHPQITKKNAEKLKNVKKVSRVQREILSTASSFPILREERRMLFLFCFSQVRTKS